MSSWEEIANEVAPANTRRGLATGVHRGTAKREYSGGTLLMPPEEPRPIVPPSCAPDAPLDLALQGAVRHDDTGSFYRIVRLAAEFDAVFENLTAHLGDALDYVSRKTKAPCSPRDLLFTDIETTGLSSSTPLFLIGTLRQRSGGAQVELFLARGFEEERAALAAFHEIAEGKTLVTFNGERFDWPYIEGRSLRCGVEIARPRAHFDLLPHARRKWRSMVPNCRLQTLEYFLCHRKREGDIPSSQIPAQYLKFAERYAASGRGAHLLAPIVHHNIWDVLTMADLLRRFDPSQPFLI
jgi:uncharacterized protein YprB with RNaseH-like and TPR domain